MTNLASLAVDAALKTDWTAAIKLNKKILREGSKDIEALNRLAYALLETGDLKEAKILYQKVLRLDHANPIAEKNLRKIKALTGKKILPQSGKSASPNGLTQVDISSIFLEEPGRTKVAKLKNLAEPHILSSLRPADEVMLSIKRHSIFVKSGQNIYLGALPDDLAHRLIPLLKGGNQYRAYIKAVERNNIIILVKETRRGKRFKNNPSFISGQNTYYSSVREDAIKEERRPDVTTYEDLEEAPESESEE